MTGSKTFVFSVELPKGKYNFDNHHCDGHVLQEALGKGKRAIDNMVDNFIIINPHLDVMGRDDYFSEVLIHEPNDGLLNIKGANQTKAYLQVAQTIKVKTKGEEITQ